MYTYEVLYLFYQMAHKSLNVYKIQNRWHFGRQHGEIEKSSDSGKYKKLIGKSCSVIFEHVYQFLPSVHKLMDGLNS